MFKTKVLLQCKKVDRQQSWVLTTEQNAANLFLFIGKSLAAKLH